MSVILTADNLPRSLPSPRRGVARYEAGRGEQAASAAMGVAAQLAGKTAEATIRKAQALSETGGAMIEVGTALGREALRRRSADNELAAATARSYFLEASLSAEEQLVAGSQWSQWPDKYALAMKTAREGALKSISDEKVRAGLEIEFRNDVIRGLHRVRALSREREKDEGIAGINETFARNMDAALRAPDDVATGLLTETARLTAAAVDRGWIDAPQAGNLRRQFGEGFARKKLDMTPLEPRLALLAPRDPRSLHERAAQAAGGDGEDAAILQRIAMLESGGDPSAVNAATGAAGLFQFMPETSRQYGLKDPMDPEEAFTKAARLLRDNKKVLTDKIGRPPSGFELYLAHQQGATGAAALINNPAQNAVDALESVGVPRKKAIASITGNGGTRDMMAADFVLKWAEKFGGAPAEPIQRPVFERTGTWVDLLPPDTRYLEFEKTRLAVEKTRDEAARAEKESLVNEIQTIGSQTNGRYDTVPTALREKARALGVWDTATKFSGRSDEDTVLSLKTMPAARLAQTDLRPFRDRLSAADYEALATKQADLRDNPEKMKVSGLVEEAIPYYFGATGETIADKERLARFKDLAEIRFAEYAKETGRVPDVKNRTAILDDLVKNEIIVPGWLFGGKGAMEVQPADIPAALRADIEAELQRRGLPVTPASVALMYRDLRLAKGER